MWTDIAESEKPKIYIHDYNLAGVGPEQYDVSQRSLLEDSVQKYEHTATIKKYAGIMRTFFTLLSSPVSGLKDNEKQVMSLVATKKEDGDDSYDWELAIDPRNAMWQLYLMILEKYTSLICNSRNAGIK